MRSGSAPGTLLANDAAQTEPIGRYPCLRRLMYSRIRVGMPTTPAS
jgi:hypothetical protein